MVDTYYGAIFSLIMNGKHQENGTLSGPLILTLPASNFVAILRPDWLKDLTKQLFPPRRAVGSRVGPRRPVEDPGPERIRVG
jgi:hypothetical protein